MSGVIEYLHRRIHDSEYPLEGITVGPVGKEHAERVVQILDMERSIYAPNDIKTIRKGSLLGKEASQELQRPNHLDGKHLYGTQFSTKVLKERDSLIVGNDSYISGLLAKHLGVSDLGKLFHSPGSITVLNQGKLLDTIYRNTGGDVNDSGISGACESNVSLAYGEDTLIGMSQQKAALAGIFDIISRHYPLSTAMMQAVICIYGKQIDVEEGTEKEGKYGSYYRGLYNKHGVSVGVSGSYVYHETILAILHHFQITEPDDLDNLGEEKTYEVEEDKIITKNAGRVDILAGIFDELYGRLLLTHISEWEEHIKYVAEEIIAHHRSGALEKLC